MFPRAGHNSPLLKFTITTKSVNFPPSRVYFSHQQNSLSPATVIHSPVDLFLQVGRSINKVSPLQQSYSLQSYPQTESRPAEYLPAKGQIPSTVIFVHHPQQRWRNYGFHSNQGFIFQDSDYYVNISCSYIMTCAYPGFENAIIQCISCIAHN